jgi:hypothetical protein
MKRAFIFERTGMKRWITQTGTAVSATAISQTTGQNRLYNGSVSNQSVALSRTVCQPSGEYTATCNGAPRDVALFSRSVTGTANGNTLTGTIEESWHIFDETTEDSLGTVTVSNAFTFTR